MKIPKFDDWPVYPIIMPLDALGRGPAKLGEGAIEVRFEVWERETLSTLGSYLYLHDAIDHCLRVIEEGAATCKEPLQVAATAPDRQFLVPSIPRLSPDGGSLICDQCDRAWGPGCDPGCSLCAEAWRILEQGKGDDRH